MTDDELRRWAAGKRWLAPVAWDPTVPLERHPPPYAECGGPGDPFCGQCRFSVHSCAGAPSRAAFLRSRLDR